MRAINILSIFVKKAVFFAFSCLFSGFMVSAVSADSIVVSTNSDRSGSFLLHNSVVDSDIYVFFESDSELISVDFYIDDPNGSGEPFRTETVGPYDLAGSSGDGQFANAYDTKVLLDGLHSITAFVTYSSGLEKEFEAWFGVDNYADSELVFGQSGLYFTVDEGSADVKSVLLSASDGGSAGFAVDANLPGWLNVSPLSGVTEQEVVFDVDSSGLSPGVYDTIVSIDGQDGYDRARIYVRLDVTIAQCYPLECSDVLVDLPYELDFESDHSFIADSNGTGTGFTYIVAPEQGSGYLPGNINVDTALGVLNLTTTSGISYLINNDQDNTLTVGIDTPSQVAVISTKLVNPPLGTGGFEQAGLWYGIDQDNYIKLNLLSTSDGAVVEALLDESSGGGLARKFRKISDPNDSVLTFISQVDPSTQSISASFNVNDGPVQFLGNFYPGPEMFSFDAAGIDPAIGTRTFAGIYATQRFGPSSLTYSFDEFIIDAEPVSSAGGNFSFLRQNVTVGKPTAMVWGPDERLYVTELFGLISALKFDQEGVLYVDEVITSLIDSVGDRLTLGIAVDPNSTAEDVILYTSHSSPSLTNGKPNSGMITKLWGDDFANVEHVITGLPRALANHGTNNIAFGPDGRLYIAQGGNTGAGAPNNADTEFGDFPEQPLSAAFLWADIKDPNFDGTCDNADDIFGPAPCDVTTYSTGLRNMYDFTFHSNGHIYGTDNGLGVTGTYPPSADAPCTGLADVGVDNPGPQPDLLIDLEEGKYYGHPNPYRDECVFKDGSYQSVDPLANYEPAMYEIGLHTSSNGIIEYTGDNFSGRLKGDLLIANYSVGDNIIRVELSEDGNSVVSSGILVDGLSQPLPLEMGPDGIIFAGQFGADLVTALVPLEVGYWRRAEPVGEQILDAGSGELNGLMYVISGKTPGGYVSDVHVYDPNLDIWVENVFDAANVNDDGVVDYSDFAELSKFWGQPGNPPGDINFDLTVDFEDLVLLSYVWLEDGSAADLIGGAVENPAVVSYQGRLYVFGGSTSAFSGAVSNAGVYDPVTNQWRALSDMPAARGGACACQAGGMIYVIGGMDSEGNSLGSVDVYDPNGGSWVGITDMQTRRDNPGCAGIDGKVYVFGGRTRDFDGTETDPALQSVEMYDPQSGQWVYKADMPTGRRTMVVGRLNGRVQLIGGENSQPGASLDVNEEYDPSTDSWRVLSPIGTGRHGAAGATVGDVIVVTGGGPVGGTSFTSSTEIFSFGDAQQ